MILYINLKNEVKDVNTTTDSTLIPVEVNDMFNPFTNWPIAKICCYKVTVKDGMVTSYTSYVDNKIIEHIERQGQENINLQAQIDYLAMMTDVEI